MIFVDSSVWIDYFRGNITPQTDALNILLGKQRVVIGDLILIEVLQGFRSDKQFIQAKRLLTSLIIVDLVGQRMAIKAAENFRTLRLPGITVRKTIDSMIATYCIENNFTLLHCDKDFDAFVKHLGLRSVL
ncbi:PIN domain nuclease [Oxalobacteraceae bacterium]|nr:PIN domain nuclease [Oxalobacteraceae bacterium]